jgi:ABC-2 type transport system ATP-binding protein
MIQTHSLTKTFGNVLAVDNLSLDVGEGEIFGFLGPNGAGKTTTVRMLSCLIGATSGTARVNGFEVGKDDQKIRQTIGILTESPGFYDNLSARRNLLIYASLYEVEYPERQIEKYLNMLGLLNRQNDETGTYSKGMKQRLAIARTLLHEPKIIFLDEPTAGLDPEAARLVRDFIVELQSQKRTVFLCTHNLDEADRLCHRIAVFKTRLLTVDTPARLRAELFGRKIVVHLVNADEKVLDNVARLPFVSKVTLNDNKLLLTVENPELHNPDLVRFLVEMDVDIQFVGELRRSLEDVYLELVRTN